MAAWKKTLLEVCCEFELEQCIDKRGREFQKDDVLRDKHISKGHRMIYVLLSFSEVIKKVVLPKG